MTESGSPAAIGRGAGASVAAAAKPLAWKTRAAVMLGGAVLRVLGATWRLRVIGQDRLIAEKAEGARYIYLLWHGQMLAAAWAHRTPAKVVVSEHRDGELIARILRVFGLDTVRGSSSRGGARALMACVTSLKQGTDVAITPDGPRGPRHSFAPGALAIAHRSGVPLVGIVTQASRAWRLRTWDGFEIPKPFARVTVLYTEPRFVEGTTLDEATRDTTPYSDWMERAQLRVAALSRTAPRARG